LRFHRVADDLAHDTFRDRLDGQLLASLGQVFGVVGKGIQHRTLDQPPEAMMIGPLDARR
jgi:hypothetical protein